ncbi:MAG: single-stranded DNA-binding protein [Leptospira sp.]|nr:single-stranded DNA-binding protein [Leptospira sp.]
MSNIAHIVLDGNLTADPELKKTPNGKSVSTFSIAVNHTDSKDEEGKSDDVSFLDVEAWENTAERCAEFLKKGRGVTVIGNIKQDRWKSPDGTPRTKLKVVASSVRFNGFYPNEKEKSREGKKAA